MKSLILLLPLTLILSGCFPDAWCEHEMRPQFAKLEAVAVDSEWFKVYKVGEGVYAIAEPYNYQEVISYLITGQEKALLFDTGMGMGSIKAVVAELTDLPVSVLNSHSHYDHIGGNHEFSDIFGMNLLYAQRRANMGVSHDQVAQEVAGEAFCGKHLPDFDRGSYHIRSYSTSQTVVDGSRIDLGDRSLKVIQVPGHTPDAIALLDEDNGYLWTGDTFYEAPIWLFDQGTDLDAYKKSTETLAALTPLVNRVFTAHNTPVARPERLVELREAFNDVITRQKMPVNNQTDEHTDSEALVFEFEHFSFIIRRDELKQYGYE